MAGSCSYEAKNLELEEVLQKLSLNQSSSVQTVRNNHPNKNHLQRYIGSKAQQSTSTVRIINSAIFIESPCNDCIPLPNEVPYGGLRSRSSTYVKSNKLPLHRTCAIPNENKAIKNGFNRPNDRNSDLGAGETSRDVTSREAMGEEAWQKWYANKRKEERLQKEKQRKKEKQKEFKDQDLERQRKARESLERSSRETWLKRKKEEEEAKKKQTEKNKQEFKQQTKKLQGIRRRQDLTYEVWIKSKEKERKEQELIKEEQHRLKQQKSEENKDKNKKAVEEWLANSTSRAKPMIPIIYDPKLSGRKVVQPKMFCNPEPWRVE